VQSTVVDGGWYKVARTWRILAQIGFVSSSLAFLLAGYCLLLSWVKLTESWVSGVRASSFAFVFLIESQNVALDQRIIDVYSDTAPAYSQDREGARVSLSVLPVAFFRSGDVSPFDTISSWSPVPNY